jgi:hypothetical protein
VETGGEVVGELGEIGEVVEAGEESEGERGDAVRWAGAGDLALGG